MGPRAVGDDPRRLRYVRSGLKSIPGIVMPRCWPSEHRWQSRAGTCSGQYGLDRNSKTALGRSKPARWSGHVFRPPAMATDAVFGVLHRHAAKCLFLAACRYVKLLPALVATQRMPGHAQGCGGSLLARRAPIKGGREDAPTASYNSLDFCRLWRLPRPNPAPRKTHRPQDP